MIALTLKEWAEQKDKLANTKKIGFKVVVYGKPITYGKKPATSIYGKYELGEGNTWVRL